MYSARTVSVVIPVLNEQESLGRVLAEIPTWVDHVVVVDNGSTDRSVHVARAGGALVEFEHRRGYGYACKTGIERAVRLQTDIVVFLDGDYSDYPSEMERLVEPIAKGEAQMVIGSRIRGTSQKGALLPQALFGNWLATGIIRLLWGVRFTDLGPFRSITMDALQAMAMEDNTFGWTVEMQIKAARDGVASLEVPVSYRKRIGTSKISGTISGSVKAGVIILQTLARYALRRR